MKTIFTLTAALGMVALLSPQVSQAKDEVIKSHLYTCNLSFSAKGKSTYLGFGYTNVVGSGYTNCRDHVRGVSVKTPVHVVIKGPGIGLGVTGLNISGVASDIVLDRDPDVLLGEYLAVRGNAAVGVGVGAGANLRVAKGEFAIGLSISTGSGLGAGIDVLSVEITRAADAKPVIEALPKEEVTSVVVSAEAAAPVVPRVREGDLVEVMDAKGKIHKVRIKIVNK
jgi:hypothetical protein